MTNWDLRCCIVCGERSLVPPSGSRRRYHCLNGSVADGQEPSPKCWSHRFPTCGKELLKAIPPVSIRTTKWRERYAANVEVLAELAEWFEDGRLTSELAVGLIEKHGAKPLRAVIRRIGPESSVGRALASAMPPPPPASSPAPRHRFLPDQARIDGLAALPPDFAQTLAEWRDTCHGIQRVKQQHGAKNADNTTRRSIRDAEWLCVFFAGVGLHHWEEVAPRHFTLFRLGHGLSQAVTAFRFLKFVKSRNSRMKATFYKPKMPKSPVTERLTDRALVAKAIQAAVDADDVETALLICLVGLYAQPLSVCSKLAVGDFRTQEDKVVCKFNELWLPLDRVTVGLLRSHLQRLNCGENGLNDPGESGVCLFSRTVETLSLHIRKFTAVRIQKLRLTAVANLIARGVLDRNGIHRAFGVSMPTIAEVERIFGWQVQSEVTREARAHRRRLLNGELTRA